MNTPLEELIEKIQDHINWIEGNHKTVRVDIYDVAALAQTLSEKESELINPLDASKFNSGDRINHFYVNALRQLTQEEREVLANSLKPDRTEQIAIGFSIWTEKNGWDWSGNHQVFINDNFEPKEGSELFKDYMESLKP